MWSDLLGFDLLRSDTLAKSLCRRTQSQLGIDVRQARLVDKRKQALADRIEGLLICAIDVRRSIAALRYRLQPVLAGRIPGCVSTTSGSSRRSIPT